jgi:hypothetical protein
MSRELDTLRRDIIDAPKRDAVDPVAPHARSNAFFTFRYSYTEISSRGGDLSVKMKETRFQDGKLVSEECEGTLDRDAYDAVVREAQQQFLNQAASFMKVFFLPFSGGGRR